MAIGLCDLRSPARGAGVLWWIVGVNAVAWLVAVVDVRLFHGSFVQALALPSTPRGLLARPWSPLSYMIVHADFFHMLFNMLWLVCFGRLLAIARGNRALLCTYVGGGIAGAAAFMIAAMLFPALGGGSLIGSSAAVLAVAVAAAFAVPDMELQLWLKGSVKVKWIVAVMCLLFCAGFTGPHTAVSAHIGGVVYGAAASLLRRPGAPHSRKTPDDAAELDRLLDKVKLSGYDSLSRRDKERLFNLSHRVRR